MSSIKILDNHTINKIAAGEVVERPASVVKELVENSIDAKASSITVEIKNGGIDFVRITDNGKGIPKDEVEIAFLRHATSKITSAEDLLEVLSLGFRGEALASIASVSQVELISKTSGELTGKRVEVVAGKLQASEEIACPDGTTFIMRHLFYNIPARKAFLKTAGTEASKIADYMYKLALAHPEISFKYIQNNKLIFNTPGTHDLRNCVLSLYGKEVAKNTIKVNYSQHHINLVGLLGKPSITRGNRNYEHFFINGRYIKSFLLQKAVEEAYKTLTMVGKFPFAILHLNLDPSLVDVNVHPTKLEVRFKDSDMIYQTVYNGVLSHLQEENLIPGISQTFTQKPKFKADADANTQLLVDTFFAPRKEHNELNFSAMIKKEKKTSLDKSLAIPKIFSNPEDTSDLKLSSYQTEADVRESSQQETYSESLNKLSEPMVRDSTTSSLHTDAHTIAPAVDTMPLSPKTPIDYSLQQVTSPPSHPVRKPKEGIDYQIIGQLFNTYWLIEHGGEVLIIDQHAAHERVMYERFMKDFTTSSVSTQVLLMPETINLPASEMILIEENLSLFEKLGFNLEIFGDASIILREVPYLFNKPLGMDTFKQMLDSLDVKKTQSLYTLREEQIIQMACKSAIKANDKLDSIECKNLIEELLVLDNPYTCPHGRPTIVSLRHSDIEKIFKRI
ncbi:MAG: DNA mismatch repair endonuclease MutL [Cellulosilyticaceae bacterium]